MLLSRNSFLPIVIVLGGCTASVGVLPLSDTPSDTALAQSWVQSSEINFGPDAPLSSGDRALLGKLAGKNISFFYDQVTNGSQSRSVSRIRLTKNGDVYYFANYGGQVPGQNADNGEVFRLSKAVDFIAEPKRAASGPSELMALSFYKGKATLENGILTLFTSYGGISRANGAAATVQTRFELAFSPDGNTCNIRSYSLKVDASNGNTTDGHSAGTSQCSVGGAVNF